MDDNFGSTTLPVDFFDFVRSTPITFPAVAFSIFLPGSSINLDFICHHEDAVEADAKFSDECIVFLTVCLECFKEFLGSRMCNGTKVLNQLFFGHTNTKVLNS